MIAAAAYGLIATWSANYVFSNYLQLTSSPAWASWRCCAGP